ncbi:unnamed protein product [Vicia faba]|uniref:HVA22-like protein n=1 Tax=Vicia faba TaxID=3906 RepID=A0AAV1AJ39_VICFA|nr:unnamed protein product [Vicia faba]
MVENKGRFGRYPCLNSDSTNFRWVTEPTRPKLHCITIHNHGVPPFHPNIPISQIKNLIFLINAFPLLLPVGVRSKMGGSGSGSGAADFLMVLIRNIDVLAGPVVSLVYPLYASVRAIESKSPVDDQQWLTYWVLYSMITLFELTFAKILEWIPIWPYAKLILTCWKKDVFSKPDDIITAAEKYIKENGTEAFENLIHRADKSQWGGSHHTKSQWDDSHHTMYDEHY